MPVRIDKVDQANSKVKDDLTENNDPFQDHFMFSQKNSLKPYFDPPCLRIPKSS